MSSFVNGMKTAILKGMEAIGKGASSMANNAQQKLTEINLETRRREILSDFPMRAYDLWQKGAELPEPLGDMLREIGELDERLSVMRAQRYAKVETAEEEVAEETATDSEIIVDAENAEHTESAEEPQTDADIQADDLEAAFAGEQPYDSHDAVQEIMSRFAGTPDEQENETPEEDVNSQLDSGLEL